jgi:hypothetical protein
MTDDEAPDGAKISSTQMREVHALLRDHGISGDKAVHAYLDTWLAEQGLPTVESRADLPARVAAAVIRDLRDKAVLHAPGGLTRALIAIQKVLPVVAKTQTAEVAMRGGGTYSYSYASLGDVMDAAMPLLIQHDVAWTCLPRQAAGGGYELVGTLLHVSGERLEGALPLHGNDPQVIGGAMTYHRRYLLGAMLGIVTDTDPDARATRGGAPRTQSWDGPSTAELLAQIDVDAADLGTTYAEAVAPLLRHLGLAEVVGNLEALDARDPWEIASFAKHLHARADAARADAARAAAYVGPTTEELLADLEHLWTKHAAGTPWGEFTAKYRAHRGEALGLGGPLDVDAVVEQPAWSVAEWHKSVSDWIAANALNDDAPAQS